MICVVCGRETGSNHRCPKSVEAAWQAKQTKALNEETFYYEQPRMSENVRLFVGLATMEREGQ